MNLDFYQFYLNTKVLFQPGIAKDFQNELDQLKVSKLFLICDPYFVKSGLAQEISEALKAGGSQVTGVFSEVPPNSELQVVKDCAACAKESGAEALMALGGGSAMDTAKTANILFSLGGDLVEDYSGAQTISEPLKPLIAIPTTAGTGSEVTAVAVILDASTHTKLSFSDSYLRPSLALLDPELTLSLPPQVTAMTGMDALTHAIESYTSLQANPMSDALAKEAIGLIMQNLIKAVRQGDNIDARSAMMVAANMAGIAFDHALVGVVHSMSHATGGVAGVPHGLANSILLPYGMEYNLDISAERYSELGPCFGMEEKLSSEAGAKRIIKKIYELRSQLKQICDLPERLSEAGVNEKDLPAIAELAVEDGSSFYNPKEVIAEEVLAKLKEAY